MPLHMMRGKVGGGGKEEGKFNIDIVVVALEMTFHGTTIYI